MLYFRHSGHDVHPLLAEELTALCQTLYLYLRGLLLRRGSKRGGKGKVNGREEDSNRRRDLVHPKILS